MVTIPPICGDHWGMVYYCFNHIKTRYPGIPVSFLLSSAKAPRSNATFARFKVVSPQLGAPKVWKPRSPGENPGGSRFVQPVKKLEKIQRILVFDMNMHKISTLKKGKSLKVTCKKNQEMPGKRPLKGIKPTPSPRATLQAHCRI